MSEELGCVARRFFCLDSGWCHKSYIFCIFNFFTNWITGDKKIYYSKSLLRKVHPWKTSSVLNISCTCIIENKFSSELFFISRHCCSFSNWLTSNLKCCKSNFSGTMCLMATVTNPQLASSSYPLLFIVNFSIVLCMAQEIFFLLSQGTNIHLKTKYARLVFWEADWEIITSNWHILAGMSNMAKCHGLKRLFTGFRKAKAG